ncbi:MAG: hypothetical protein H7836_05895 [Magnetococcus sp. YQC-3]
MSHSKIARSPAVLAENANAHSVITRSPAAHAEDADAKSVRRLSGKINSKIPGLCPGPARGVTPLDPQQLGQYHD